MLYNGNERSEKRWLWKHRGETKQNTCHELEVQNEDLWRKMSEDFDISQEETGFPLL